MYIVLSVFILYFTGLGLLVHSTSPVAFESIPKTKQEAARFIAFNFLLGISVNHLLMLLIYNMKISLIVGAVLSIIGYVCTILITSNSITSYFKLDYLFSIVTILTVIIFSIIILNTKLGWDSQYIWFFHGKMIFFNNGLSQKTGLSNPAYQFSHVDYPKLIAILAAQFAYLINDWNDYIPRLSLLILLIPAILGALSFCVSVNISFFYLYLMIFFSINEYTTNGYMDAYLAIYACLSLLFLWRWAKYNVLSDALTGFAFISIIPLMKNEGMLYLVSVLTSFVLVFTIYKNKRNLLLMMTKTTIIRYMSLILLLNIVIWSLLKYKWNLNNDLNLGVNSFKHIIDRITDGSVLTIIKIMLHNSNIGISTAILLITIYISIKKQVFKFEDIAMCITATSIYLAGIFIIYMATPHDLIWHLTSSSYRTMMPINMSILTATYIVMTTIESSDETAK